MKLRNIVKGLFDKKQPAAPLPLPAASKTPEEIGFELLDELLNRNEWYADSSLDDRMQGFGAEVDKACLGRVQKLLEAGASLEVQGGFGGNYNSPLIVAVISDFSEAVSLLCAHGAPLDAKNKWGETADSIAAKRKLAGISSILGAARAARAEKEILAHMPRSASDMQLKSAVLIPARVVFKNSRNN